jgi:hypothetical protein
MSNTNFSSIESKYQSALLDLSRDPEALAQAAVAREQADALRQVRDAARAWQSEFDDASARSALSDRMQEFQLQSVESRRVAFQLRELRRLVDVAARTRKLDAVVANGNWVDAAKIVLELRQMPVAAAWSVVANDVTKRCDAVAHRVNETFLRMFGDITSERWTIESPQTNAIEAVMQLNELDTHLTRIVKRIMRTLVSRINTVSFVDKKSSLTVETTATLKHTLSHALDSIGVLIGFIRKSMPSMLADVLLPRLAPELVDALAPLLDFEQFAAQRLLVQQFEQQIYAIGLSARLADGEQRYAARLHATALEQARASLSASSYPNPLETSAHSSLHLDKEGRVAAPLNGASSWRVTRVATQIVDSLSTSTTSPAIALDIVTLYSAIIRLRASQIANVPAQALLLLADVQFVVRRLRALPPHSLAVALQLHALEIEADAVFDASCAAQCAAIDESWADTARATQRIELQFGKLAQALGDKDVGPRNACAQLMARTLRHVVTLVSDNVLSRPHISADDCTLLHTSLTPLVAALERHGDVDKLRAVVDVLPMSIVQLHAALPRLRKALSADELGNLIRAMFQDSEKRSKLLSSFN